MPLRNNEGILKRWERFFCDLLSKKSHTLNPGIVERVTR